MQPEKVEFLGGCSNPLSAPPAAGFWVESRPAGCFLAFYTVTSYGLYIRGTWNCFASHRSISSSLVYQRPNDPNQLEGIHFGGASTRFASVYQWESSGICWLVVTVRHAAYIRQRRRKVGLPAVTHSATGNQWDSVNPLRRLRTIIAIPWLVYLPLMGGLLHLVRQGGAWAGCGPAKSPPRCRAYQCNSPPINGQCTNFILFDVALYSPLHCKVNHVTEWASQLYLGAVLVEFCGVCICQYGEQVPHHIGL